MPNIYKPLYKKFLRLKITVHNKHKFLKFRKHKWNIFKLNFIKFHCRKRTRFHNKFFPVNQSQYKFYDHFGFLLPSYENYYKNKYKFLIHTKQKLSLFYGGLSKKYLKKIILNYTPNCMKRVSYTPSTHLIEILESRLDTILCRSKFTPGFRNARALIGNKKIIINGKITNKNSYPLKKGDLISIKLNSHFDVRRNILHSNLWPIPQKYLNVNYKTFEILYTGNVYRYNLAAYFPFCLNANYFFNFYRV